MVRRPPDPSRGGLVKVIITLCLLTEWALTANAQQQQVVVRARGGRVNGQGLGDFDTRNNAAVQSSDARAIVPYAPDERSRDAVRAPASGLSPAFPTRDLQDWMVEDVVLLATVDGSIYAADRNSGQQIWALHTENAMVETIYHPRNRSVDGTSSDVKNDFLWIVEPSQDGALYGYEPGSGMGIRKLGFTVKLLAEDISGQRSEDPPVVYAAEKRSSVFEVDYATGSLLGIFSARHTSKDVRRQIGELDTLDDDKCGATDFIALTRTEYIVGIASHATGEQICTIKYSEWGPNGRDKDLFAQYVKPKDDRWIHTKHNGEILALGPKWNFNENGDYEQQPIYRNKFASPVARVFDIARKTDSKRVDTPLVLLPQPLNPSFVAEPKNAVFVNCTEDGGWYALSEENYPLVTKNAVPAHCADQDLSTEAIFKQVPPDTEARAAMIGVHTLDTLDSQPQIPLIPRPSERPSIGGSDPVRYVNAGVPWIPTETNTRPYIGGMVVTFTIFIGCLIASAVWVKSRNVSPEQIPVTPVVDRKGFLDKLHPPYTPISPTFKRFFFTDPADMGEAISQNPAEPTIDEIIEPVPVEAEAIVKPTVTFEEPLTEETEKPADPEPTTKKKAHRGRRGGKKEAEKRAQKAKDDPTADNILGDNHAGVSVKPDIIYQSASTDEKAPAGLINLEILSDVILGQGSGGTIVFGGKFEGRDVAVKRMLGQYSELASQEVSHLEQSEDHPNVIRYFCRRQDEHFLYIALELCQASLYDVFRDGRHDEVAAKHLELAQQLMSDRCRVLRQLAEGLKHLHSFRIIHRDIKPQNMLIAYSKKSAPAAFPRVVISDFGLCKTLPENASTLLGATISAGTTGWKAPELIFQPKDLVNGSANSTSKDGSVNGDATHGVKRAIDIFSLGCVFFYIITGGKHPFDDDEGWMGIRERNIKANRCNLGDLEIHGSEIKDLIAWMISPNPEDRPTAAEVLAHPFFWSAEDKLEFLTMASDRFDLEERDPPSSALRQLESQAEQIIGPGPTKVSFGGASPTMTMENSQWQRRSASHDKSPIGYVGMPGEPNFLSKLDKKFIETLGKQRKYQGYRLADLLRALRNKHNHWDDMPDDVKAKVGTIPDGYYQYWESRFPSLLVGVWRVVKDVGMTSDRRFDRWYCRKVDL